MTHEEICITNKQTHDKLIYAIWGASASFAMLTLALQVYVLTKHNPPPQAKRVIDLKYQYKIDGVYYTERCRSLVTGNTSEEKLLDELLDALREWHGADSNSVVIAHNYTNN